MPGIRVFRSMLSVLSERIESRTLEPPMLHLGAASRSVRFHFISPSENL